MGSGYDLAAQKARVYQQNGWIELSITVDANGNQKDLKVILEAPPGFGLGTLSRARVREAFLETILVQEIFLSVMER